MSVVVMMRSIAGIHWVIKSWKENKEIHCHVFLALL